MLFILLGAVCFFFLVLGAAAFVFCGLVPPFRRFALSVALWFVVWGPCVCGWVVLAGLALAADGFAASELKANPLRFLSNQLVGWAYLWVAILGTAIVATALAWLHHIVVRRFTFALFRIYAALVSAGVGSVWVWAFMVWLGSRGIGIATGIAVLVAGMGLLIGLFGYAGYRWARELRGEAPERFPWVSRDEYEGLG